MASCLVQLLYSSARFQAVRGGSDRLHPGEDRPQLRCGLWEELSRPAPPSRKVRPYYAVISVTSDPVIFTSVRAAWPVRAGGTPTGKSLRIHKSSRGRLLVDRMNLTVTLTTGATTKRTGSALTTTLGCKGRSQVGVLGAGLIGIK